MTPSNRQSNIELLRILSMFGVLILHADFGALGEPSHAELLSTPSYTISRSFIEAFTIMAVNVFVMISGWFGIKFRYSSLCNLLFQCAFFFFGIFGVLKITGLSDTQVTRAVYMCLMLSENAWFVKAYIGMYLFAPVMNAFVKLTSRKQFKVFLISFFTFQSLYGWLSNGAPYIASGYSAFSFMGLYLLARYIKIYQPRWSQLRKLTDFGIYFLLSCTTAAGFTLGLYLDSPPIFYLMAKYSSILIIAAALFLLLGFSKMSFENKAINWIAESCFAVYLFHFIIFPEYMSPAIAHIGAEYRGILMVVCIFALLMAFFATAITIDKLRLFVWNHTIKHCFDKTRENEHNTSH